MGEFKKYSYTDSLFERAAQELETSKSFLQGAKFYIIAGKALMDDRALSGSWVGGLRAEERVKIMEAKDYFKLANKCSKLADKWARKAAKTRRRYDKELRRLGK